MERSPPREQCAAKKWWRKNAAATPQHQNESGKDIVNHWLRSNVLLVRLGLAALSRVVRSSWKPSSRSGNGLLGDWGCVARRCVHGGIDPRLVLLKEILQEWVIEEWCSLRLRKERPEEERQLERIVKGDPVEEEINTDLNDGKESVDNPIDEPLSIVSAVLALDRLERFEGRVDEADYIAKRAGTDARKNCEEGHEGEANDKELLGDFGDVLLRRGWEGGKKESAAASRRDTNNKNKRARPNKKRRNWVVRGCWRKVAYVRRTRGGILHGALTSIWPSNRGTHAGSPRWCLGSFPRANRVGLVLERISIRSKSDEAVYAARLPRRCSPLTHGLTSPCWRAGNWSSFDRKVLRYAWIWSAIFTRGLLFFMGTQIIIV